MSGQVQIKHIPNLIFQKRPSMIFIRSKKTCGLSNTTQQEAEWWGKSISEEESSFCFVLCFF